jgi:hypothetical protein
LGYGDSGGRIWLGLRRISGHFGGVLV